MLRVGRALLLLALVATQGCWLQTGFGPDRRGYNDLEAGLTAANVADLEVRWTAQIGGWAGEAVLDRGTAFVPGREVTALSLATGAQRWAVDIGGATRAAMLGGKLRLTVRCTLWSLDPDTGTYESETFGPAPPPEGFPGGCGSGDLLTVGTRAIVPWTYAVPPIAGAPGCRLGYWYYGPGITAIDVEDPSRGWERSDVQTGCQPPPPPPPWPPGCCWPPPTIRPYGEISSDRSFVLVPGGQVLLAMGVDCAATPCPTTWSVDVGATIAGPAVVLVSGDLAVPTTDGRVVVVDGTTHQVAWTAEVGAPLSVPLAANATTIFAAAGNGTVAAFPADGCGAATCAAEWTATLGSPASARPSIGGDVLYVGSADGTVTAFPAEGCGEASCESLWTGTTPNEITGAPAIHGGTVVVGSSGGTVTAFARPDA